MQWLAATGAADTCAHPFRWRTRHQIDGITSKRDVIVTAYLVRAGTQNPPTRPSSNKKAPRRHHQPHGTLLPCDSATWRELASFNILRSGGRNAYLVELEPHQSLDERRLAAGLVPHHQHGRRVERLVEVLRRGTAGALTKQGRTYMRVLFRE